MEQQQLQRLNQLRMLGKMLDSRFQGPLGIRYGFDGIIGLLPIFGDLVTSALSLYIIIQAAALGCTPATLTRMALNVMIENIIDMIPLAGNLFDFVWKANLKNLALIESHLANPQKVTWQSRTTILCIALVFILVLLGTGYLGYQTLKALWEFVSNL